MDSVGSLYRSRRLFIVLSSILLVLVGIADYLTGTEIYFSIFYLLPVSLVSWHFSVWYCISFSSCMLFLWFINEHIGDEMIEYL